MPNATNASVFPTQRGRQAQRRPPALAASRYNASSAAADDTSSSSALPLERIAVLARFLRVFRLGSVRLPRLNLLHSPASR